jgi:hypothetical protein
MMSSPCGACSSSSLFPFWCLDDKAGEDSYPYHFFFLCVVVLSCVSGGHDGQDLFNIWLIKPFMEI